LAFFGAAAAYSALVANAIGLPLLLPGAARVAAILGAALLVAFLTGPGASLASALRIGRISTDAILKGDGHVA
jgi:hypothetical protein